jgi:hypothetical protein
MTAIPIELLHNLYPQCRHVLAVFVASNTLSLTSCLAAGHCTTSIHGNAMMMRPKRVWYRMGQPIRFLDALLMNEASTACSIAHRIKRKLTMVAQRRRMLDNTSHMYH